MPLNTGNKIWEDTIIKTQKEPVPVKGRESKEPYTWEKPREIIIIGMGPSRGQCPYDAETWSLNMGYIQTAHVHGRLDKIFMVHKQVVSPAGVVYFDWSEYLKMAEAGIELWNIHDIDCERCGTHIPFKKYPFREIVDKFDTAYFSDTVCYQIAYALHICTNGSKKTHDLKLKYPLHLRFYGVDMQDKEEYGQEKGGIEHWLGYAQGIGAEITISQGSTLLLTSDGIPYGFDKPDFKYLDPYMVLSTNGERVSEEFFQEHFDEIIKIIEDMTKNIMPPDYEFQGELSKGLHRINVPNLGLIDDNT